MASNTDRIFMAEQIKVRDCNLSKHSSSNTASTTTLLSCSLLDNRCLLFKYNIFILSSVEGATYDLSLFVCVVCVERNDYTFAVVLLRSLRSLSWSSAAAGGGLPFFYFSSLPTWQPVQKLTNNTPLFLLSCSFSCSSYLLFFYSLLQTLFPPSPPPQIPDELPTILKEYTKEVIRSGVTADQVIQWSADYFAQKAAEQKAAANPEA